MTALELVIVLFVGLVGLLCALVLVAANIADHVADVRCDREARRWAREQFGLRFAPVPTPPTEREVAEVLVEAEAVAREAAIR